MPEPPDREAWEDQREAFAFELLALLEDSVCEVFFGDEAGFEGDPRPRHRDKLVKSIQHLMDLPKIIRSLGKTHSE